MAPRVTPAPTDSDNHAGRAAGNSALARCNDWRAGARRFHVGTGHPEPTHDAGYTTAGVPAVPQLSISLFPRGGSPYTRLGAIITRPNPKVGVIGNLPEMAIRVLEVAGVTAPEDFLRRLDDNCSGSLRLSHNRIYLGF